MRDELIEFYEGLPLAELVEAQGKMKDLLADAEEVAKTYRREFDLLRKEILPDKMNEMGIQNATFKGIGRVSLRNDAYVSTKAGKRQELMAWLEDHNSGDLITATVNASTLKAFIKEQDGLGNPIPSEEVVNFTPFQYAAITKG